mgnify:CR=1 FL=1
MNIGDHLVTTRTGYTHHGLYVGNNEVIHYSSDLIEKTSLYEFSNGNEVRIKSHIFRTYDDYVSVERAYSRLGEDWYNVIANNCEHFVTWCIVGFHSSSQVNTMIASIATGYELATAASSARTAYALSSIATTAETKSIVSTAAGWAAGSGAATTTASTAAGIVGAASVTSLAAPIVAGVAVAYGAKKVLDWFWD